MKFLLKKITLKEDTLCDIHNGNYDTNKFIEYISVNLKNANYLIENKIKDLSDEELYDSLTKVYDIKFDDYDILEMLSSKYGKHYVDIVTMNTNMIDDADNNISYVGARTKKVPNYTGRVSLNDIRNLTNSHDFLVFKTLKYKLNSDSKLKSPEKYENHQFISIDSNVDKSNELYDYALELLVKEIRSSGLKKVLNDLESYVGELKAQAKSIVKLSDVKDDPELKKIGDLYRKAYEQNFTNKQFAKKSDNHKRRY